MVPEDIHIHPKDDYLNSNGEKGGGGGCQKPTFIQEVRTKTGICGGDEGRGFKPQNLHGGGVCIFSGKIQHSVWK